MTYKELKTHYTQQEFGAITVKRDFSFVSDQQDWQNLDIEEVKVKGWVLELYHQCDEWKIGNTELAREMISNLELAIKYCEDNP